MIADAVRLMLLGVKLFRAGQAISSRFDVRLGEPAECRLFKSVDRLVIQVSLFNREPSLLAEA
jgi:hypothetical protein